MPLRGGRLGGHPHVCFQPAWGGGTGGSQAPASCLCGSSLPSVQTGAARRRLAACMTGPGGWGRAGRSRGPRKAQAEPLLVSLPASCWKTGPARWGGGFPGRACGRESFLVRCLANIPCMLALRGGMTSPGVVLTPTWPVHGLAHVTLSATSRVILGLSAFHGRGD